MIYVSVWVQLYVELLELLAMLGLANWVAGGMQ